MRKLHLWLGLASGLIVFIIAITGCIYAFQQEIQDATQPYRFVQAEQKPYLLPSQLQCIAEQQLPDKAMHSIQYNPPGRAAEAMFYGMAEQPYFYIVYLNPYSGQLLKTKDMSQDFFRLVLYGHFYLWLPPTIGQPVVATAMLVFLVLVVSGLVLWFPRNIKALQYILWFRWSKHTKLKRKNADLHSVIGFYVSAVALVFILTGLVWGYEWFASSYHKLAGGEKSLQYAAPPSTITETIEDTLPTLDRIYLRVLADSPQAKCIELNPAETDSASIAVVCNSLYGTYWKRDYRYFDQYSLQELQVDNIYGRFEDANKADKLMRMNYDIHTGAIFGLAGKILAFCFSLLIASLPITGFFIWWNKRKREATS